METVEKKKLEIILKKLFDNTNKSLSDLMNQLYELEDCNDISSINKKVRAIEEGYKKFIFYANRLEKIESTYNMPNSTKYMYETIITRLKELGIFNKIVK